MNTIEFNFRKLLLRVDFTTPHTPFCDDKLFNFPTICTWVYIEFSYLVIPFAAGERKKKDGHDDGH